MFAIVEAGGRQEKVAPGALVIVDHLEVPAGAEVKFDKVLLAEAADGSFVAGSPYIAGASVTGVVEAQTKAKKIVVEARVSKSGNVTPQAGDLAGSSAVVAPGAANVRVQSINL